MRTDRIEPLNLNKLILAAFVALLCPCFLIAQDLPKTVAESSDFKATSRSAEVETFIQACDDHAPHISSFQFGETVEGRPMTAAVVANPPYDVDQPDERVVALLLGNIHSGECAGKEGLLQLLRELAETPDHPWLEQTVIVFVPNYNADGNDAIDLGNRPGQVGPEEGMGRRTNAQQKDLNRDFIKLETNEAQALIELFNEWNPHLFVDCHTTNGSRHQYCLTYDVPHNPSAPEGVVTFMRNEMMPTITEKVLEQGKHMFYYGNFNRDRTRWTTYGYEPRYSTEYAGIRGRLGVLSEAYSYISYRERIEATHVFVSACLDYVSTNAQEIRTLLDSEEQRFVEAAKQADRSQPELMLTQNAEVDAFDSPVEILAFNEDEPAKVEVEFYGRYRTTESRQLPYAYLVPSVHSEQVRKLQLHGIEVEQLSEATALEVEIAVCREFIKARRSFQGHQMARFLGELRTETMDVPAGTFVIRTAQPLGKLAGYMLDPQSGDGLTTWNFFDDVIEEGKDHPILAIIQPSEMKLETAGAIR